MFTYEKHQVQTHAKIKEVVSIFFNLGKKKKKKIKQTQNFPHAFQCDYIYQPFKAKIV